MKVKMEFSKKIAVVTIVFMILFLIAIAALIVLFPVSGGNLVALAGVFVPIPLVVFGFYFTKSQKENEIKLQSITNAVDSALNKASEMVSKSSDTI